jgi:monoamine oxidase
VSPARRYGRALLSAVVGPIAHDDDRIRIVGDTAEYQATDAVVVVVTFPLGGAGLIHFVRFGMTSDPTDLETARAIFAALCHLGCA